LNWHATILGATGDISVGQSDNEVMVSLGDPIKQPQYVTVVWLGCTAIAADGDLPDLEAYPSDGMTNDEAVNRIWDNVFSNPGSPIYAWAPNGNQGIQLCYYKSYTPGPTTTQSLLTTGDGRCGSWARLMIDVLGAQGIGSQFITITPSPANGGPNSGFLVNNWSFDNSSPIQPAELIDFDAITDPALAAQLRAAIAKYPYIDVFGTAGMLHGPTPPQTSYDIGPGMVTDENGIPGQGTPNPASIFSDHALVQYKYQADDPSDSNGYKQGNSVWFDPSYGSVYAGPTAPQALQSFDTSAIAGLYQTFLNVPVYTSGLNYQLRQIMLVKEPTGIASDDLQSAESAY
jgi:hypothetical protein